MMLVVSCKRSDFENIGFQRVLPEDDNARKVGPVFNVDVNNDGYLDKVQYYHYYQIKADKDRIKIVVKLRDVRFSGVEIYKGHEIWYSNGNFKSNPYILYPYFEDVDGDGFPDFKRKSGTKFYYRRNKGGKNAGFENETLYHDTKPLKQLSKLKYQEIGLSDDSISLLQFYDDKHQKEELNKPTKAKNEANKTLKADKKHSHLWCNIIIIVLSLSLLFSIGYHIYDTRKEYIEETLESEEISNNDSVILSEFKINLHYKLDKVSEYSNISNIIRYFNTYCELYDKLDQVVTDALGSQEQVFKSIKTIMYDTNKRINLHCDNIVSYIDLLNVIKGENYSKTIGKIDDIYNTIGHINQNLADCLCLMVDLKADQSLKMLGTNEGDVVEFLRRIRSYLDWE
jgi:hypothetical protein